MQFVVLGVGDKKYEDAFKYHACHHPDRVSAQIRFDEALSRRLYACGDILLVPSRFEPCGLSQMIAMRYGTVPIVRETGGLKDSVEPYNKFTDTGTGFSFANFNAHELLFTIRTALSLYRSGDGAWQRLQKRAMAENFSWDSSAKKYIELYKGLKK
jgi:starch synthase